MTDERAEAIAKRRREAAKRVLEEAEARRKAAENAPKPAAPREVGGAAGPEPTRYGDWEKKGIVSDF